MSIPKSARGQRLETIEESPFTIETLEDEWKNKKEEGEGSPENYVYQENSDD